MNIDKILEYQELDGKIYKLEQNLENNDYVNNMKQLAGRGKEVKGISETLEIEAEKAYADYKKIEKNYNDSLIKLKNLEAKKEKVDSEAECNKIVEQLNNISGFLKNVEKNITVLANKINTTIANFETAKANYATARNGYNKNKIALEKLREQIEPEIKELVAQRAKLEKGINKVFLEKYKARRQDKIFPVVTPLINNGCGRCCMELPSAQIVKLKKDGFLECENCHRIIYYTEE